MFNDPYIKFFMNSSPVSDASVNKKRRKRQSPLSYGDLLDKENIYDVLEKNIRKPLTGKTDTQTKEGGFSKEKIKAAR